jgi:hypothetical protein
MLHALADRGEARILATVVSSRFAWSAPCVEAINRYYGRPDLPIGVPKGEGASTRRGSKYARQIAEAFTTRLRSNDDAPDAAAVYRLLLASQPDRSVTVVTVGYLTNLRDLLATGADAHSGLPGPDLVRRKVRRWVCMGGRYPEHLDPGVYGNFKPDPAAAAAAVRDWPGTIHFSGLGRKIQTGRGLPRTPEANPVRRAYALYLGKRPTRSSWDQVAVLFAVRPDAAFWQLRTTGYNHLFENGTNQWRDEPDKDHVLVELKPDTRAGVESTIEALMVRPPASGSKGG